MPCGKGRTSTGQEKTHAVKIEFEDDRGLCLGFYIMAIIILCRPSIYIFSIMRPSITRPAYFKYCAPSIFSISS